MSTSATARAASPGTLPLPTGFRIELDRSVRRFDGGRVLIGGAPARVMRLSDAGRAAVACLCDGSPSSNAGRTLGRRLIDAGMAHPLPPGAGTPDVTVVIPVRERAEQLDVCLRAVGGVAPALVVDDGSARAGEIAAVCRRHDAELIRRREPGGPAAARNAALARIETELVAFIDSDCVPPPRWLETLAAHFADPLVGAVAPRIAPTVAGRRTVRQRFAENRSPLDMGVAPGAVAPFGRVPYVPTAALVVRTAAVTRPFDPDLRYGEDVDFVWRLRDAGWRVRYDPAVRVAHREPDAWRLLLRRRMRYGTSAAPLSCRHGRRLAPAVLRPWPTAATALLLAGRPCAAALVAALPTIVFTRAMHGLGVPPMRAVAWSAGTLGHTIVGLGRAATAVAAPALIAALTARRTRAAAIVLLAGPPLEQWVRRRPPLDPLRWTITCLADDVAYGIGVWHGCLRDRTAAPLTPALGRPT